MVQNEKKNKKWHQRWWGIVILFAFSVLMLYVGAFIYQVVVFVEAKNQSLRANYNSVSSQSGLSTNLNDVIATNDDPALGATNPQITIVEFSDFQCPYCKQAYPIVKKIASEYKDDVKIIYRDFPVLSAHPDSLNAALAADCALEQKKFWQYHDLIFESQTDLSITNLEKIAAAIGLDSVQFDDCLESQKYLTEVQNDLQDGSKLGFSGTPTFFINGTKVEGVIPYVTFKEVIEKLIQAGSQDNIK
jgi:protein-disulfide isomerase